MTTIASGGDQRMLSVDEMQERRLDLTREEFAQRFPFPFLIRRLEGHEISQPLRFGTSCDTARIEATDDPWRATLSAQLRAIPDLFGIYVVQKAEANPWKDRITIGRATNNDIILRNASVSKLHAYFTSQDGDWYVHDAGSSNGTRVNGKVLPRDAPQALYFGDVIGFGFAVCEFSGADALYRAL